MYDQANDLRRLVRRASPERAAIRTRLVVVAGGKGGTGTTTLAVNLAAALAAEGRAVALVDADPAGGNVGLLCRLADRLTIADVLAGRCSAAESLQTGPAGLRVLAGGWGTAGLADCPGAAQDRLIAQLQGLGPRADLAVIDAGNAPTRFAHRFWQSADELLLVTTPELAAVMDAYAAVKLLAGREQRLPIGAVVNLSPDKAVADGVHQRLRRACRRFLGVTLCDAGWIPWDPQVGVKAESQELLVSAAPHSPAAVRICGLAKMIASSVPNGRDSINQMIAGSAPKGRDSIAQGAALGDEVPRPRQP
jgi:flagellar biosynthesis protein FlhG